MRQEEKEAIPSPDLPVLEVVQGAAEGDGFVGVVASVFDAREHELFFLFGEEVAILWEGDDERPGDDADHDG